MSYAIRNDGAGWRAVNGPDDVAPDETFSEAQPAPVVDYAAQIRAQRVPLLAEADALVNKAEDVGVDPAPARAYRQALRDVTKQKGFPTKVVWPKVPV